MKKLFTLFLALVTSVGTLFAVSGTCGENLTWDLTDGVLTISGTGDMANWEWDNEVPWYSYRAKITSVIIGNSVTSIGYSAFNGCSGLTSVTIPNSVTSIEKYAFYFCDVLTSITIPNSVTSIGIEAFGGCSGLTSILVENGNPVYDSRDNCNAIIKTSTNTLIAGCQNTTIPNSVTSIGLGAFFYCSTLTSVTIPNSVTSIGDAAFPGCTSLTSVTIGNRVTTMGEGVFYNCSSLTSVTIPNSLTNIGKDAFNGCSGLTSVTIGNSVINIEFSAFAWCTSLTHVTIPNSVTSIGLGAFYGCTGLTSVTIGNSVTNIGPSAFGDCTGLTSVTIPNSVTVIGLSAFSGCSGLTSVTIGNSVTRIRDSAFENCSGLTSVTIPNSVTSIEYEAFRGCSGLTSVTIGNSVTSIGSYAFYECSGLTSITCEAANPPTCGNVVFYKVQKTIPLNVPANSVDDYKKADGWKEFGNNIHPIQAAESAVTEINAVPTDNSVVIEWPKVDGATVYTIEIRENDYLICTHLFDEQGKLLSISFEKKAGNAPVKTATQTATGWQYTISGLEANTDYSYTVIAKKNESDTEPLYNKTIPFKTTGATSFDQITNDQSQMTNKIIKNGQIYIQKGNHTYTLTGQEVR